MKYIRSRESFLVSKRNERINVNIDNSINGSKIFEIVNNDITWGGSWLGRLISSTWRYGKDKFVLGKIDPLLKELEDTLFHMKEQSFTDVERKNMGVLYFKKYMENLYNAIKSEEDDKYLVNIRTIIVNFKKILKKSFTKKTEPHGLTGPHVSRVNQGATGSNGNYEYTNKVDYSYNTKGKQVDIENDTSDHNFDYRQSNFNTTYYAYDIKDRDKYLKLLEDLEKEIDKIEKDKNINPEIIWSFSSNIQEIEIDENTNISNKVNIEELPFNIINGTSEKTGRDIIFSIENPENIELKNVNIGDGNIKIIDLIDDKKFKFDLVAEVGNLKKSCTFNLEYKKLEILEELKNIINNNPNDNQSKEIDINKTSYQVKYDDIFNDDKTREHFNKFRDKYRFLWKKSKDNKSDIEITYENQIEVSLLNIPEGESKMLLFITNIRNDSDKTRMLITFFVSKEEEVNKIPIPSNDLIQKVQVSDIYSNIGNEIEELLPDKDKYIYKWSNSKHILAHDDLVTKISIPETDKVENYIFELRITSKRNNKMFKIVKYYVTYFNLSHLKIENEYSINAEVGKTINDYIKVFLDILDKNQLYLSKYDIIWKYNNQEKNKEVIISTKFSKKESIKIEVFFKNKNNNKDNKTVVLNFNVSKKNNTQNNTQNNTGENIINSSKTNIYYKYNLINEGLDSDRLNNIYNKLFGNITYKLTDEDKKLMNNIKSNNPSNTNSKSLMVKKWKLNIDADDSNDPIIKICRLFGYAHRLYYTPVIPSGRPGGKVSQRTFRRYTFLGSDMVAKWDANSAPQGPFALTEVLQRWIDGVMKIIQDKELSIIFKNATFKVRGVNIINKGGTIKLEYYKEETPQTNVRMTQGQALFNFMNDMIDRNKLGNFEARRSELLKNYFGIPYTPAIGDNPNSSLISTIADEDTDINHYIWGQFNATYDNLRSLVGKFFILTDGNYRVFNYCFGLEVQDNNNDVGLFARYWTNSNLIKKNLEDINKTIGNSTKKNGKGGGVLVFPNDPNTPENGFMLIKPEVKSSNKFNSKSYVLKLKDESKEVKDSLDNHVFISELRKQVKEGNNLEGTSITNDFDTLKNRYKSEARTLDGSRDLLLTALQEKEEKNK